MKVKLNALFLFLVLVLAMAQPALAAQEDVGTTPPDWFAWLLVILAVGLPVALVIYLRSRGRL